MEFPREALLPATTNFRTCLQDSIMCRVGRLMATSMMFGFISLLLLQPALMRAQQYGGESGMAFDVSIKTSHHPNLTASRGSYQRRPGAPMDSKVDSRTLLWPAGPPSTPSKSVQPRPGRVARSMSLGTMAEIMGMASSSPEAGSTGSCDVPGILQCLVIPGRASLFMDTLGSTKEFPDFDGDLFRPMASEGDGEPTSYAQIDRGYPHLEERSSRSEDDRSRVKGRRLGRRLESPEQATGCSDDLSSLQENCLLARRAACETSENIRNASAIEKAQVAIDLISYIAGHYYTGNCSDSYEKSLKESVQKSRICDPGVAMKVWSTCISEFYADLNHTRFSEEKFRALDTFLDDDEEELESGTGRKRSPGNFIPDDVDDDELYVHSESASSLLEVMSQRSGGFYDRSSVIGEDNDWQAQRRNEDEIGGNIRSRTAAESARRESDSDSSSNAIHDGQYATQQLRRRTRRSSDGRNSSESLGDGDSTTSETEDSICCPKMRFLKCIYAAVWRSDDCVVKRHKRNMLRMGILFASQFYGKDLAQQCSNVSSSQLKACFATPASSTPGKQPSSAASASLTTFLAIPSSWDRSPSVFVIPVLLTYVIHYLLLSWCFGAVGSCCWRTAVPKQCCSPRNSSTEVGSAANEKSSSGVSGAISFPNRTADAVTTSVILPSLQLSEVYSSASSRTTVTMTKVGEQLFGFPVG